MRTARVDDSELVGDALLAARVAQSSWAALSPGERGRHLLRVRESIADHARSIAEAISDETGKPAPDAWAEVMAACGLVSWSARRAPKMLAPRRVPTFPFVFKRVTVHYEPLGVVGVITPWNYPVAIPMQSIPVALVGGNAILFKPSELAPRAGGLLAQAINAAGRTLVHVVTGEGRTGEAVVRSGVEKVVFTGSGSVGQRILHAAADGITPVVLELGGKDPLVVCEDADLERAARTLVGAGFTNAGQLCMATERAYVVAPVYDRFVEAVIRHTRRLRVGPGPDANLGPLTRPAQLEVLEARLADAVRGGARIVVGGHRRDDLAGSFFAPTVVVDVDPDAELIREESFGPIVSIVKVADADEAIRLANDHPLGLNASVFTRDRERAARFASALEAGGVHINDALLGNAVGAAPFGGVKRSGFGRLQGDVGLYEFVRTKSVVTDRVGHGPALAAHMAGPRRPSVALLERSVRWTLSSRRPTRRLARFVRRRSARPG